MFISPGGWVEMYIHSLFMQAYLDSARKGGEVGRTAGVPYNFSFFLHKEDLPSAAKEEGAAATADTDGAVHLHVAA